MLAFFSCALKVVYGSHHSVQMKRQSHKNKLYAIRRCRQRAAKLARFKRRAIRRATRFTAFRQTVKIKAPTAFRFLDERPRRHLFAFLDLVKQHLENNFRVVIDFGNTNDCHPCGTLIFMSHLDIWLTAYPNQLTCTYPSDPVTEELLQHVSVLSRLGLSSRKTVGHDRVKYWHYHSGTNADSTTYKELTNAARHGIIHPAKELFADCLNEAVVNTVGHAYKFTVRHTPAVSNRKWWMFSLYRDEQLFVAIYDQGIGIPRSLRRKPEFVEYLKYRTYNDARLIQAAIGSHMTSTRLPHRGKGLPEMLEFSQSLKSGGLSIWSQNGGVAYNADSGEEKRHHVPQSLPGTLVLWSIPFREEQNHAKSNDIRT